MPLINFRTDLKSLRYGKDRPGEGYSGQPYIKSPSPDEIGTPTDPVASLFADYYEANRNTLDYPIRGGVLDLTGPNGRPTTLAGRIDAARIKAFLSDPARGKIFKLKQAGLQLTNPNTQVAGIVSTLSIDGNPRTETIPYTRLYGADSTIAQVLVQGTGQHIPRHGLLPQYTAPFQRTYEYFATRNNAKDTNRLSVLYQTKMAIASPFTQNSNNASRITAVGLLNYSNKYNISPLGTEIFNYFGGPGSLYGIGFTIIKRAVDTSQAAQKAATISNAFTLTYQQLLNQDTAGASNPNARQKIGAKLQDFRKQLLTQTGEPGNYLTSDYNDKTKWYNPAIRGDQGAVEKRPSRVTYVDVNESKIDKVNALNPFAYNADSNTPWEAGGDGTKDIIKFAFECLSNDYIGDAVALIFRAYLTSFTDNHSAEYNSFKYLGRGETFRTYQGFDRSISFSFKIAAQSRSEMKSLYKKLNHLISQTYPDYSTKSNLMRGSVVKLTIGDYLYRVSGFLESVNITVLNEAAWEIALDAEGIDKDMNQVPQMLDVQCSFKPIHDFLPRRATYKDSSVQYIGREAWGTSTKMENKGSTEAATELLSNANKFVKESIDEIDAEFARLQEIERLQQTSDITGPLPGFNNA